MTSKYLRPPGSYYSILAHPSGIDKAIEAAVIQDHRFAFYYWFKWWKDTGRDLTSNEENPPALVTLDWHRDLCAPGESEMQELSDLDLDSYKKTALYCWEHLNSNNDTHILSAAFLNLIGDIHVLCKQDGEEEDVYVDISGNHHKVKCYTSLKDLEKSLLESKYKEVYFDIDLDYFTESDELCGGGENLTLSDEKEILNIINPKSEMMKWIFQRMNGFTIATELECCGGMSNSNKIYSVVDCVFFEPQLLSKGVKWRHLL